MGLPRTKDGRDQTRRITDPQNCNYPEKGGRAMMKKTTAAKKADVQDDDDPNGLKTANKPKGREAKSQLEGPAAYAPHDESEKSNPFDSRFSSPPDAGSKGGGG
jgi:hypothetical protein